MSEYVFQEYPKWVHPPGQPSLIVQNRAEEDAVMAPPAPEPEPEPEPEQAAAPVKGKPGRKPKAVAEPVPEATDEPEDDGDLHDDA